MGFRHFVQRSSSLEKAPILGKMEGEKKIASNKVDGFNYSPYSPVTATLEDLKDQLRNMT